VEQDFVVRPGDLADAPIVTALFDDSIRWMVARDMTAQWGSTPFSRVPKRVESIQKWSSSGGLRICERDGRPAAAMVLGEAQPYVSSATEPEIYDCFAGNDGALVRFYERCGYTKTETFTVGEWPGQVLERRIDVTAAP
jgi:hypothetical protein